MSQNAALEIHSPLTSPMGARGENAEGVYYGLPLGAWLKIGIVALLMIATFRFNLLRLWLKTNPVNGEPNWRHAVCVPLISLYYLYFNREDLLKATVRHSWSGLGILVAGIVFFGYGIWPGQNDFIKDFGMIVTLFGVVVLLCGWDVMKVAWFPIVFLICAIPWPDLVYSKVASPLQHLAASIAVGTLRYTGVDALNSGTKIIVMGKQGPRTLNVAEACAGLRSLMTFISIGGAVAFLSTRPMWQKMIVTASAVPIAIFCNVMRVTGMGYIDQWKPEYTEGFAHQFVGMVMLVPGFLLIMLVGLVLDQLFIEELDEKALAKKKVVRVKQGGVNWSLPKAGLSEEKGAVTPAKAPATAVKPAVAVSAAAPAARAAVKPAAKPPVAAAPAAAKTPAPVPAQAKPAVAAKPAAPAKAPVASKPASAIPPPKAVAPRAPQVRSEGA
jgi:exosortase